MGEIADIDRHADPEPRRIHRIQHGRPKQFAPRLGGAQSAFRQTDLHSRFVHQPRDSSLVAEQLFGAGQRHLGGIELNLRQIHLPVRIDLRLRDAHQFRRRQRRQNREQRLALDVGVTHGVSRENDFATKQPRPRQLPSFDRHCHDAETIFCFWRQSEGGEVGFPGWCRNLRGRR